MNFIYRNFYLRKKRTLSNLFLRKRWHLLSEKKTDFLIIIFQMELIESVSQNKSIKNFLV